MKEIKTKVDLHCFICTNQRDGAECCAQKSAKTLRKDLKDYFKQSSLSIKVSESSCLGGCSEGIVAMIYPQRIKITNIEAANKDELIKKIEEIATKDRP